MRVLWVGHNLAYPPVRGVLQRNYNLLRQASRWADVHVLAFDQPATRPAGVSIEDCVEALKKYCVHVEWVALSTGWSKNRYWLGAKGLVSRAPYDLNWLASNSMADRLQRTLGETQFDAVHFDTIGLAQYRNLVRGAGTILNHHNVESSMMGHRAANETRRIPRLYWKMEARKLRRSESRYCPQFDENLVVSPEDAETLRRISPGLSTTVVPNGVDTEYFTPRADPGGHTLLFCGGLDWYPNADAMVYFFEQIWPPLLARLPDLRVVVVGRRPPSWLTDLAKRDGRIQVTGFVDDVRPYFEQATVYVCPIRIGGGTRLKILDALAMGMPLIGTTFACSGISVGHEREVLLADTPEEFARQVQRALSDENLRARLALSGRAVVCEKYSWSVIGDSLSEAYRHAHEHAIAKNANNEEGR
jgi:glycosyltransferase involved in cell wall biosynthesis